MGKKQPINKHGVKDVSDIATQCAFGRLPLLSTIRSFTLYRDVLAEHDSHTLINGSSGVIYNTDLSIRVNFLLLKAVSLI